MNSNDLLTPKEVAEILRRNPDTIRAWIKRGELPSVRLPSGQRMIRRADLNELLTPTKE